ncbi:MAG TPA: nuclear transport factor 2 family protein [Puia sp.]|nr:nuclear transport factor 2 family protein [Puia sp.]
MKKLFILSSLIILVACNMAPETKTTPAFDPASAKAEILAANQQFEQAFVKGDSSAITALYHTDAKIFPANMSKCNRDGVGSMTAGVPKLGIKTMKLNTDEVSGGPDEVVETGNYEMGDGTKALDKGNYIVIWKKEGEKWKMYRDIWNSSMPMPMAAK